MGAGAGKSWDLFPEDTGILLGTGPGYLNWGTHYALTGQEFVDEVEVALWFYPEDQPPLYESTSEYHQLIDQFSPGEPRARDILIPPHGTQTLTRVVVPVLCSQSLFRFADLGDDGLCRGGPDKGCGVIVSAIDVVVDRLD